MYEMLINFHISSWSLFHNFSGRLKFLYGSKSGSHKFFLMLSSPWSNALLQASFSFVSVSEVRLPLFAKATSQMLFCQGGGSG
jgi:hypothetical protein